MTHFLPTDSPASQGMCPQRLERASALLAAEVAERRVAAASMLVARNGRVVPVHGSHSSTAPLARNSTMESGFASITM